MADAVEIKGMEEIASRLENPANIDEPSQASMGRIGMRLFSQIQSQVPRKTGATAESVFMRVGRRFVVVGSKYFVWRFIEFGTQGGRRKKRRPGTRMPTDGHEKGTGIKARRIFAKARTSAKAMVAQEAETLGMRITARLRGR